ncbi:unnamed protein product [Ceutorhynchus assimilis]|uniref:alpha-1,2-Mannosidase n=1 Tax=Ceutorhynchus assimilis TaxID=467358 RepID=A0A9P0DCH7_9CUCU|nr:unnamed protein product [Ceutorhynchus assimilis]
MKILKTLSFISYFLLLCFIQSTTAIRTYTKQDLNRLRDEVKEMFYHSYDSYLKYAYPYDELRPISCDGIDTYGSYSLTLIDALDTLAIMGNYTEFQRVVDILSTKTDFDANINVSVFETNIRIIGGLLSAHLLSSKVGIKLEPGFPCNGPLLRLAEDVAKRLIVAFDTKTGMPYGTVNLRHGVPKGLFGNHIDTDTGRWTAQDAGIGSGVDSYFEYLVKGSILLQRPELMEMFYEARKAIDKHLKKDDWYMWVSMTKGQVTLPVFQSLESYWPGVLSLIGETSSAMRTLHNYHQVWQQYGFTPEFYYITQNEAGAGKESYPLRPELIESIMYLYRSTRDPFLLEAGEDILRSIKHSARTPCGYATIKDVRDHRKEDRMESFFLSETTKYLYLLFDTDNFIHNQGQHGTLINTPNGECVIDAGGYIFNTEAHPIDPSALHCCHNMPNYNLFDFKEFQANEEFYRGVNINKKVKKVVQEVEKEIIIEDDELLSGNATVVLTDSQGVVLMNNSVIEEKESTTEVFEEKRQGKLFDPQQMLERFRRENKYPKNESWENNYELLSCRAQKFLQRISIMGEFFN